MVNNESVNLSSDTSNSGMVISVPALGQSGSFFYTPTSSTMSFNTRSKRSAADNTNGPYIYGNPFSYFAGANNTITTWNINPADMLMNSDWTFELYCYVAVSTQTTYIPLVNLDFGGTNASISGIIRASPQAIGWRLGGTSDFYDSFNLTTSGRLPWYHIGSCYKASTGTLYTFHNGIVSQYRTGFTFSGTQTQAVLTLQVANVQSGQQWYANVRVSNTARYTSSYTLPGYVYVLDTYTLMASQNSYVYNSNPNPNPGIAQQVSSVPGSNTVVQGPLSSTFISAGGIPVQIDVGVIRDVQIAGNGGTSSIDVPFRFTFFNTPTVVANVSSGDYNQWITLSAVTFNNNGFTLYTLNNYTATTTHNISWIAIG